MADDFFGPASDGAVSTRPTLVPQIPLVGSAPSWFAPCSSEDSEDGTQVSAEWLNRLVGNLEAVRLAGGIDSGDVPPGDDDVLLAAILALITQNTPDLSGFVTSGTFVGFNLITASGTWTKTSGAASALVLAQGGGGGGAYGGATSGYLGGGGGGGALAITRLALAGVASVSCVIGAGGTGGTSGAAATAGGTTSFGTAASAGGGGAGSTVLSTSPNVIGGVGGVGGTATVGSLLLRGAPGQTGAYASGANGGGGFFGYGAGVGGEVDAGANQRSPSAGLLGGGGGGGDTTQTGGAGGAGCILVLEFK